MPGAAAGGAFDRTKHATVWLPDLGSRLGRDAAKVCEWSIKVGDAIPAGEANGLAMGLVRNPARGVSGYPSSPATSAPPIMAAWRPGA